MTLRQARGYDVKAASNAAQTVVAPEPVLTRQEFKEDSDINVLLKRFGVTGKMPAPLKPPEYGDFSAVTDFETAMLALKDAEQHFERVPAELRDRFDNDPHEFLEFVQDDENYTEAAELGLVPKKKEPEPAPPPAPNPEPEPTP